MTVGDKTLGDLKAYIDRVNDALTELEIRLIKLESLYATLEVRVKKREREQ